MDITSTARTDTMLKNLRPVWPLLKRVGLLLLIVPVAAWALVKPVRVVAPPMAGVTCLESGLCIDDESRLPEATALYQEAQQYLATHLDPLQHPGRVVFCAQSACADAFGLGERSAVTVGEVGSVIGPRAWRPYYVRHELIHQLQSEHLGLLSTLLKPQWWTEGMAYELSGDPRDLLAEPWQSDRRQFREWFRSVGPGQLWTAAAGL